MTRPRTEAEEYRYLLRKATLIDGAVALVFVGIVLWAIARWM